MSENAHGARPDGRYHGFALYPGFDKNTGLQQSFPAEINTHVSTVDRSPIITEIEMRHIPSARNVQGVIVFNTKCSLWGGRDDHPPSRERC